MVRRRRIPGGQQEHRLRGGRAVSPRRRPGWNRRRTPAPQRLRAGRPRAHAGAGGGGAPVRSRSRRRGAHRRRPRSSGALVPDRRCRRRDRGDRGALSQGGRHPRTCSGSTTTRATRPSRRAATNARPHTSTKRSRSRRGPGEPLRVILVVGNLGLASLFTADLDGAAARFAEELRLCREHGLPWIASEGIAGLAAIAARQGDAERAARLLGAAESLANVLNDAGGVRLEQEFFSPARERIGERRWRRRVRGGRPARLRRGREPRSGRAARRSRPRPAAARGSRGAGALRQGPPAAAPRRLAPRAAAGCSSCSGFFFEGASSIVMLRPSCWGDCSTVPRSATSSASRISSRSPRSGWVCSRPRNMIVTFTRSSPFRKRTTWFFLVS